MLPLPGYTPASFSLVWSVASGRLAGTVGSHPIDQAGSPAGSGYNAVLTDPRNPNGSEGLSSWPAVSTTPEAAATRWRRW